MLAFPTTTRFWVWPSGPFTVVVISGAVNFTADAVHLDVIMGNRQDVVQLSEGFPDVGCCCLSGDSFFDAKRDMISCSRAD